MNYELGHVEDEHGRRLVERVRRPIGFLARAKGLLGEAPLGASEGMWFDRCSGVHTVGMVHAIDVVFIRGCRVVRLCPAVSGLSFRSHRYADTVLELAAGGIEELDLFVSQGLKFRSAPCSPFEPH